MLKRLFCWTYDTWLSKAVGTKQAPLVRALDFVAGSECKYCMAVRCLIFGAGLAITASGGVWVVVGLALAAVPVLMAVGERR